MRYAAVLITLSGIACVAAADVAAERYGPGRFGNGLNFTGASRTVTVPYHESLGTLPLGVEAWVKLDDTTAFNILFAVGPKAERHWEVYADAGTGKASVYLSRQGDFKSDVTLAVGQWHFVALHLEPKGFALYVDGREAVGRAFDAPLAFEPAPIILGGIERENLGLSGMLDEFRVTTNPPDYNGYVPDGPAEAGRGVLALLRFEGEQAEEDTMANEAPDSPVAAATLHDALTMPQGDRFLDEVQDEQYQASSLHGDAHVEFESRLPLHAAAAQAVAGAAVEAPERQVLSLDGEWLLKEADTRPKGTKQEGQGVRERWFAEGFDRSDWRRVQVPASVQRALIEIGELEDPHWDDNTYRELNDHGEPSDAPWHMRKTRIEQKDWWFAKRFTVPADWEGKRIRLHFDGIDYWGSFYLNGNSLGAHAGMFGGPTRDVSGQLEYGEENELLVRIDSIPDDWNGILKGSPGWGWHYGHLVSMGIWRSVQLEVVPEIELRHPFVKTERIGDDGAELAIEYMLTNDGAAPVEVEVTGTITPATFEGAPISFRNRVTVPFGMSRFETRVAVKDARLWWPMNYGDPDMYRLAIEARSADGAVRSGAETRFGIRTIEKTPLRGTRAEADYRWQFVVNGVPLFIKGANWCWTDPMLDCDPAKYEHILETARRGGIMMFRAWGGGIIETDDFYRLCDEKGLMVYQEFPYCWGPPDFPTTDPAVLDQQVSQVVKRLRNHPGLIMWGGGNENVGITGNDEGLFLVGRRCRQFDPTRPFHRTSPWGGSAHNWGVFHNGLPIDSGFDNNPTVFYGEFGLPTMPNWDANLKYLPLEKLEQWPPADNDGGIMAHLNQFGYGDMAKLMRYADYGPITSWKQYIEYGQMAQGDEIAFAANQQRAGSYLNKGGLWFYKMTELFPGQSWGVLDFYGQPKLAYYRAKQIYAPQAAFAHYRRYDWADGEPFKADLYVNNDSSRPLENVVVTAVVYGSDLSEVWRQEYAVDSVETASRKTLDAIEVSIDPALSKPFLLAVAMRDADGKLISDQWSWFNFRAKTEEVKRLEEIPAWGWPHERAHEAFKAYGELPEARLLTLPRTTLAVTLERTGDRGVITVSNTGDIPAFNVIIDRFPYEYGTYLDANSFGLYPGETRRIGFDLSRADQSLENVTVKAWNADAQPLE